MTTESKTNLSEHFTLQEMEFSATAARKGIKNKASKAVIENLTKLCTDLLEPIRKQFGPITVISGYRSVEANKAVGGVSNSQHIIGQACDFQTFDDHELYGIYDWIVKNKDLKYDQVIFEFGSWIHISWKDKPRRENLIAKKVKGKTVYSTYNGDISKLEKYV